MSPIRLYLEECDETARREVWSFKVLGRYL